MLHPSGSSAPDTAIVGPVRAQLERILASEGFVPSESLSRFLRYIVEETLQGRGAQLKEYVIGAQVFGRGEAFDPRIDPIVRVQAGKLRNKLKEYYEKQPADHALIDLPKGTYAPVFKTVEAPAPPSAKARPASGLIWAACLLFLPALAVLYVLLSNTSRPRATRELSSIAVLPFADLSPAKDQEYFCDGIAEEISNELAQVTGLRVAARTSAFQFKGKAVDARAIGGQLSVRAVLEGSVRKSGDRMRITAELVNTADGYRLWSQTFDRPTADIFAVQDEIARATVAALQINLSAGRATPPANRYASNPGNYELYLRGRFLTNAASPRALEEAVDFYGRVLKNDPGYAPALSGLADAYRNMSSRSFAAPTAVMPKARQAALNAIRLDDSLAEAHNSLAAVLAYYDWDWAGSARELERALQLNPYLGPAHRQKGQLLLRLGRFAAAEEEVRRAQVLDPISKANDQAFIFVYYFSRQYDRAEKYCLENLGAGSSDTLNYYLGRIFADRGMLPQAVEKLEEARKLRNDPGQGFGMLGNFYARAGRKAEAVRLLEEGLETAKTRHVAPISIAQIYIGLGDKDQAFHWLDRACEEHDSTLSFLRIEPAFDPLRSDPRFDALLRRVHLDDVSLRMAR